MERVDSLPSAFTIRVYAPSDSVSIMIVYWESTASRARRWVWRNGGFYFGFGGVSVGGLASHDADDSGETE